MKLTLLDQEFNVSPLCISFFPSGRPKSLTIWRQENITVDTRYGQVKSRFGFEITENGKLKSIEPSFGTALTTKYGILYPYDSENFRLHAEGNSLSFDENGKLLSAKTIKNKIKIEKDGKKRLIEARKIEDTLTGFERLSSLKLIFGDSSVSIENVSNWNEQFEISEVSFVS
ncbi:MAG: hypothetical protein IJ815_08360 [Lachnospiraceae bacterium]|nr:hypothetical protein [Lachnospiraceae bacterium]